MGPFVLLGGERHYENKVSFAKNNIMSQPALITQTAQGRVKDYCLFHWSLMSNGGNRNMPLKPVAGHKNVSTAVLTEFL